MADFSRDRWTSTFGNLTLDVFVPQCFPLGPFWPFPTRLIANLGRLVESFYVMDNRSQSVPLCLITTLNATHGNHFRKRNSASLPPFPHRLSSSLNLHLSVVVKIHIEHLFTSHSSNPRSSTTLGSTVNIVSLGVGVNLITNKGELR